MSNDKKDLKRGAISKAIVIIIIVFIIFMLAIYICYKNRKQGIISQSEEFCDLSINSLTNFEMDNELKKGDNVSSSIDEQAPSQLERISLFDIESYTRIDYSEDFNNRDYHSYDKNFKGLTITRIQPNKNKEKYPEFLYIYEIQGQKITDKTTSQYAYTSLDRLLSDISWKGIKYNYLTPPNTYKDWTECDNTPSHINGISQSEYEDIKSGKYPNIKITEDTTNNSQSNNYTQNNNEKTNNEQLNNEDDDISEETTPDWREEYEAQYRGELVKTYNTKKVESEANYHRIKILKYKDNTFSYEMYWCLYEEELPSRSSSERFNTINDALISAVGKGETKWSISDLTEE